MLLPVLPRDVFTVAAARRQGATQRQLEWAVETGRLHRLRRGVLCVGSMWSDADPTQRTVLMAQAVAASRPPEDGSRSATAPRRRCWVSRWSTLGVPSG